MDITHVNETTHTARARSVKSTPCTRSPNTRKERIALLLRERGVTIVSKIRLWRSNQASVPQEGKKYKEDCPEAPMPGLQACVSARGASTLKLVETRREREPLFSKCTDWV
ncbi:Zinc-binding ribosomal protein family protein, partial [Prunus dulcis]